MNVTIEEMAPCRRRLKIEVPAQRVEEEFEKITDEFLKEAKLPGFRRGKAPRAVVQKKFGKDIEEEMQRALIRQSYHEAVQSKNLDVVSSPRVEDLQFARGFAMTFSTVVDLAPQFTLPSYKGLRVATANAAVSEEEVNQAVEEMRESQAEFNDSEPKPIAMGDYAVINYTSTCEGKSITDFAPVARGLSQKNNFWLWMKEDAFLPKFAEQCVGMQIGERREIQVEFPADFMYKELAGKKAEYSVELTAIKSKKLPEIDDVFAQGVGQKDVAALRAEVRMHLENNKRERAERKQKGELVKQLLESATFDLPDSIVEEETRAAVYDILWENQSRGVAPALLEEKKDEIYANANKNAREVVKLGFIARKIAEEEKIEVSGDELAQRVHQMAMAQQTPVEKLVETLQRNNGIASLEQKILVQKVLDFLLSQAKVE